MDGQAVDHPSPRWQAAMKAWETKDVHALDALGIGVVVEDEEIIADTNAGTYTPPWILTTTWLLGPIIAGLAFAAVARSERQLNPMKN